jgi:hypothetical protein
MSDNPVFVYAAVYADRADAETDYGALLELHSEHLVGSYDVALMYKGDEGKAHVSKHEKPTQHGAWTGAAVGALVGSSSRLRSSAQPSSAPPRGGGIGHVLGGMSRGDAKELGAELDDGQAALVGGDRRVARRGAAGQGAHARDEDRRARDRRRWQEAGQGARRAAHLTPSARAAPKRQLAPAGYGTQVSASGVTWSSWVAARGPCWARKTTASATCRGSASAAGSTPGRPPPA